MAVTHSRYKFVAVSLPKRFRNGRFTSETAAFEVEATGVVIGIYVKYPGGPTRITVAGIL
jgi:hypothetical protein